MKLLVLVLTVLSVAACTYRSETKTTRTGDDGSGAGGMVDPGTCKSRVLPSDSGESIRIEEMFGQDVTWKLVHGDGFMQSLENNRNVFVGFTVDVRNGQPSFERVCAGASAGLALEDWKFLFASVIRGTDGTILQVLKADVAAGSLMATFTVEPGNGDKLDFRTVPARTTYIIRRLSADTVELWVRLPNERADGEFIFRTVYQSVPGNP